MKSLFAPFLESVIIIIVIIVTGERADFSYEITNNTIIIKYYKYLKLTLKCRIILLSDTIPG